MSWTRPERKPVGECPTCGASVYQVETETARVDVPPFSPSAPSVVGAIPGPSIRTYWPCGHREEL